MSWYAWLILAVCVVGYVMAWRIAFRALASHAYRRLDWEEVAFISLAAAFCACFFPFILVTRLVPDDPEAFARRVGGESRAARRARLRRETRERERELGIGGP